MKEMKNFGIYVSFFKGGFVDKVTIDGKNVSLFIRSVQTSVKELQKGDSLDKDNRISGRLILTNVDDIEIFERVVQLWTEEGVHGQITLLRVFAIGMRLVVKWVNSNNQVLSDEVIDMECDEVHFYQQGVDVAR